MARSAALRMIPPGPVRTFAHDPDVARVAGFVRGFSIEATRLDTAGIDAIRAALPIRTSVYLPAIQRRGISEQVASAAGLRRAGLEPVPHIAARDLDGATALDEMLARFAGEAGVRRVLVIAGDRDRPAGPFKAAIGVIESGLLQRHGIREVGIAGYPQGHPRIVQDELHQALAAKIDTARETGISLHIVTQFCFDADAMLAWLLRLRSSGIDLPIRLGMAGPTTLSRLLRYARHCGVRASAQGLARNAGLMKHLLGTTAPDGTIRVLARAGAPLGEVVPHFYSFGGAAPTARWAAAAAAGRIVLGRADGFSVEPP